jgi:hypothetical protein
MPEKKQDGVVHSLHDVTDDQIWDLVIDPMISSDKVLINDILQSFGLA